MKLIVRVETATDWGESRGLSSDIDEIRLGATRPQLLTAFLADAFNLGLQKMAAACPGTSVAKLSWLVVWHIRCGRCLIPFVFCIPETRLRAGCLYLDAQITFSVPIMPRSSCSRIWQ
jgi:hypothetical protein